MNGAGMITAMHGMIYGLPAALVCSTALVIALLPSKGVPRTFDKEMYWTSFAASGIGALILMPSAEDQT